MINLLGRGYLPCAVIHRNPPDPEHADFVDYKHIQIRYDALVRWIFLEKRWNLLFDEAKFSANLHDYHEFGEDPETGELMFLEHNYIENYHWWNGEDDSGRSIYETHAIANIEENAPYEARFCQVCIGESFGFFRKNGCRKVGHVDQNQITNDPNTTLYFQWDIDESFDFEIVLHVVIPTGVVPQMSDKVNVYTKVFAYGQWLRPEDPGEGNFKKIKIRIDSDTVGCNFNMYYDCPTYGVISESQSYEISLTPQEQWDY